MTDTSVKTGDLLSAVAGAIRPTFQKELVYGFNRISNVVKHIRVFGGAGQSHQYDIVNAAIVADVMPEGYNFAAADPTVDNIVKLSQNWATYATMFELTDLQMAGVMTSGAPNFATSASAYLMERIKTAASALTRKINTDVLSGAGTATSTFSGAASVRTLTGLISTWAPTNNQEVGAISAYSSSATYGGVAKNAYSFMTGSSFTQAQATALTFYQLDQLITLVKIKSGVNPNLIVVSPTVGAKYRELFRTGTTNVRLYSDASNPSILGSSDEDMYFGGCKVVVDYTIDETSNAGKLFVLNTDYIKLISLPYAPDFSGNSQAISGLSLSDQEEVSMPLDVQVIALPKMGLSQRWLAVTQLALEVSPFAHGYLSSISIT